MTVEEERNLAHEFSCLLWGLCNAHAVNSWLLYTAYGGSEQEYIVIISCLHWTEHIILVSNTLGDDGMVLV
jgi:hypothetical protein